MKPANLYRKAKVAAFGIALFLVSLLLPLVLNVKTFKTMEKMIYALELTSACHLLDACVRLVLMNTLRITPTYLGALVISDLLTGDDFTPERFSPEGRLSKSSLVSYIAPVLLIPLVYMVIEAIYGIRYDFKMPAILSIATVVATLRISRIEATKSLGKAALIVIQLVFGFQWLDIVPALTRLGFGHGEVSQDLKVIAAVLGGTSLFNVFGLVASGILIINGLISAKFIVDYHDLLRLAELEKHRSLDLERIRSEAVLARSYREIQALVHDLKTPLTTIQGLASAMAEFEDHRDRTTHARRISRAAERMDAMVQEMMNESTRGKISAHEFAKRLASHLPEEKTLGLVSFEVSPELPHVFVNQIRMVRAVVNLIDNALDSGAHRVKVQFESVTEALQITVSDDGPGMSEEALARCWEGGYSTKESTGLGLMFVKQIVEEHQGTIAIQSAPDAGTSCKIKLPCFAGGEEYA